MKINTVKRIFLIFLFLFLLWFAMAATDLLRVKSFALPVFARPDTETASPDGCSGTYHGLGWHIHVEGNFQPDAELPGVTQAEYYLFDNLIFATIRD